MILCYKNALLGAAILLTLAGCGKDDQADTQLLQGESKALGNNGVLSTYARSTNGRINEVGIRMNLAAFNSFSANPNHTIDLLDFPPLVTQQTGITFAGIDWNPHGHPPMAIYDTAHFDMHFYLKSRSEILAIPGGYDSIPVEQQYIPAGYGYGPPGSQAEVVPQMGVHYVDFSSPEFTQGGEFTKTFVYGFYRGEQVFFEPMITAGYLAQKRNETIDIKQPAAYQRTGLLFPTRYSINYSLAAQEYTILLKDFVMR